MAIKDSNEPVKGSANLANIAKNSFNSDVNRDINRLMILKHELGLKITDEEILDSTNEQTIITQREHILISDTETRIVEHEFIITRGTNEIVYTKDGGQPRVVDLGTVLDISKRAGTNVKDSKVTTDVRGNKPPDRMLQTLNDTLSFDIETYYQRLNPNYVETLEDIVFKEVRKENGEHARRMSEDPVYREQYEKHLENMKNDPEYRKKYTTPIDKVAREALEKIETQVAHTSADDAAKIHARHMIDKNKTAVLDVKNPSTASNAFLDELTNLHGKELEDNIRKIFLESGNKPISEVLNQFTESKALMYQDLFVDMVGGPTPRMASAFNAIEFDKKAFKASMSANPLYNNFGEIIDPRHISNVIDAQVTDSKITQVIRNAYAYSPGMIDHDTRQILQQEAMDLVERTNYEIDSYIKEASTDGTKARQEVIDELAYRKAAHDFKDSNAISIEGDNIYEVTGDTKNEIDMEKYRKQITQEEISEGIDKLRKQKIDITSDEYNPRLKMSDKKFVEEFIPKRIDMFLMDDANLNYGTQTETLASFRSAGVLPQEATYGSPHKAIPDTGNEARLSRGLHDALYVETKGKDGVVKKTFRNIPKITARDSLRGVVFAALTDNAEIDERFVSSFIFDKSGDLTHKHEAPTLSNSAIGSTAMAIGQFAFSTLGAQIFEGTYHNMMNKTRGEEEILTTTMVQRLYGESGNENITEKHKMDIGLTSHVSILPALALISVSKMSDRQLDDFMGKAVNKIDDYVKNPLKNAFKDISNTFTDNIDKISKNVATSFKYGNIDVDNKMMGIGFLAASAMISIANFGRDIGKNKYDEGREERVNNALLELNIPVGDEEDQNFIDPKQVKTDIYNPETYNPMVKSINDIYEYNNSYLDKKNQYDMIGKVNIDQPKPPKPMVRNDMYTERSLKDKFSDIRRTSDKSNINNNRMV